MTGRPSYDELAQRVRQLETVETEHRKAITALKQSEERFKLLYENAPLAYQSLDESGCLVDVNRAWLNTLGYEREEVLGRDFSDFLHPAWKDHFNGNFPRFKAVGEVMGIEFEMRRKDRSFILVSFNGSIGTDGKGNFHQTHCIFQDITQLEITKKALKKSELKFKLVTETIKDVFWMSTNGPAEMIYVSPSYELIWRQSRRSLYEAPMSFIDRIHPEDRGAYRRVLEKYHNKSKPYECEYRIIPADGEMRWIHERGYPVRRSMDDDGLMTGVCMDITDRKRAEQTTEAERLKLSTYFENLPLLAYNITLDGKIADCNEAAVRTLGWETKYDLIGKPVLSTLYAPDSRKKAEAILEKWKNRQCIENEELKIITRDGKTIDVLLNVNTIVDGNGEPAHSLSTHLIITDRKRAERALKKSEAKYRSMMEAMVDPLAICSQALKVEYINPAMARRIGRDATGEYCHRALHGLDQQCDWCLFDKAESKETTEFNVVSPLDNRSYRVTNMPIQQDDGSYSTMTIFRDITDFQNALSEKERIQAQLMKAQKMEAIGNLAGGIAHDFNNILSSIMGFTELALEDIEKGTVTAQNLEQVIHAGHRAKSLVKQILTYARQSNHQLRPIRVDLIAKEVLNFLRSSIPATIALRPNIQSESSVIGDPTQVHQIFMNLCTNAAQAMEESGGVLDVGIKDFHIEAGCQSPDPDLRPGDYMQITVLDTGKGIAPENMEDIFDPFFSTKEPGKGTGMGLAVVYGIVSSYGGKISVSSQPGNGSVFTIYLPIAEELKQPHLVETNFPTTGHERILFVDDEALITRYVYQALKRLGYTVTTRTSSVAALSQFRKKPMDFDMVITDLTMPGMSGDMLARELLNIRPGIPIILCTGYSAEISEEMAVDIGIKAFVYKPLTTADLARTVRSVLDAARGGSPKGTSASVEVPADRPDCGK